MRYLADYQHQLNSAANPTHAVGMSAYMKHQFAFLGIPAPERRKIIRTIEITAAQQSNQNELLVLAQALWQQPEREFHYCAIELLVRAQKKLSLTALPVIEHLLCTQSWWDSVDPLATQLVSALAQREPDIITQLDRWQDAPNLWLRRTAILYQLSWKTKTDTERLFQACLVNAHEQDFFIRKAIGWALRQYARTDAVAVINFVACTPLSALSKREALKHCACRPHSED